MEVLLALGIAVRELEIFAGSIQLLIDAMLEKQTQNMITRWKDHKQTLEQIQALPRSTLIMSSSRYRQCLI
jgi:hypothetical protein